MTSLAHALPPLIGLVLTTATVAAQGPQVRLVTLGTPGSFVAGGPVSLAPDGTAAVVGVSTGPLDLDGDGTTDAASGAPFVVRYAPSGAVTLARALEGAEVNALVLRPDGGLLLGGTFFGPLDLDGDGAADLPGPTDGDGDPFVASLSAAGGVEWSWAGRGGFGIVYGVAPVTGGGAVATGYHVRPLDLDGDGTADLPASSTAGQEGFVVRLGPAGGVGWAQQVASTTPGDESGRAVTASGDGSAYVCGFFQGPADFDRDGSPDAQAGTPVAVFVARYGADGELAWVRRAGAAFCSGLSAGGEGVYAAGTFAASSDGDFDGDGQPDAPSGAGGAFAVRYGASGEVGWVRSFTGQVSSLSVAADGDGAVVAGTSSGALRVGDGPPVEGLGGRDAFVARAAPGGGVTGLRVLGGPGDDGVGGAAMSAGRLALAGSFAGAADLDGDGGPDVTAQGTADLFLAVYDAGSFTSTGGGPVLPGRPLLVGAPFPNPARDAVVVPVELASAGSVRVEVLDALGRRVALAFDGLLGRGSHSIPFDVGALAPGVYGVRVASGEAAVTTRVVVAE